MYTEYILNIRSPPTRQTMDTQDIICTIRTHRLKQLGGYVLAGIYIYTHNIYGAGRVTHNDVTTMVINC